MNIIQALEHLKAGDKVRCKDWPETQYVQYENNLLLNEDDHCGELILTESIFKDEYELFHEKTKTTFGLLSVGREFYDEDDMEYVKINKTFHYNAINCYGEATEFRDDDKVYI